MATPSQIWVVLPEIFAPHCWTQHNCQGRSAFAVLELCALSQQDIQPLAQHTPVFFLLLGWWELWCLPFEGWCAWNFPLSSCIFSSASHIHTQTDELSVQRLTIIACQQPSFFLHLVLHKTTHAADRDGNSTSSCAGWYAALDLQHGVPE